MKKIAACLCLALLTTACGWHLRGKVSMPKQTSSLYISAVDSKGALITELRQLALTNHTPLTDDALSAETSIYIIDETKNRRTAGVGGDALSSTYEITLKANYEIHLKNNPKIATGTAISVRSFNYNAASINSATQEENIVDQEMRRDLAQQMLRRLNAVENNPPNEKTDSSSEIKHGKATP